MKGAKVLSKKKIMMDYEYTVVRNLLIVGPKVGDSRFYILQRDNFNAFGAL
jgi:hypothetical protein